MINEVPTKMEKKTEQERFSLGVHWPDDDTLKRMNEDDKLEKRKNRQMWAYCLLGLVFIGIGCYIRGSGYGLVLLGWFLTMMLTKSVWSE